MMKKNNMCKKCRRVGQKLFLKGEKCLSQKCPLIRRNYPPGQHGLKFQGNLSEYGRQLREKQKIKLIYNITERQLKNYVKRALREKKASDILLYQLLERRLDNIITRAGFASSKQEGRQLINSGLFLVNNQKTTVPSYLVRLNDKIALNSKKTNENRIKRIKENFLSQRSPSWIKKDNNALIAQVTKFPEKKEEVEINIPQIIEFYSR